MSYLHIFDDLSDPIMIIDQDGQHSYSNKAAKRLAISKDIQDIGSKDFQRSLQQILDGDLDLPKVLQLNDDLGVEGDFEVKVVPLNASFVLHFLNRNNQGQIGILKHQLMIMLKDEVETPLNALFYSTDDLINSVSNIDVSDDNRALLNKTLEDGASLLNSIWRIKILSDLYTNQDITNYEQIIPISLLNDAVKELDRLIKKKFLSVNIETSGFEVASFVGSKDWLALAVKESMKEVMRFAKENEQIKVTLHLHGYFITIKITNSPSLNLFSFYNKVKDDGLGLQSFEDIKNNLDFDLFLADRVVELHGGTLKSVSRGASKMIIIELPVGRTSEANQIDGLKQAKLYATDLAILQKKLAENEANSKKNQEE